MAISMRDIASECGVSRTTVSLILNGKHQGFNTDTIDLVMDTSKKLGYRKNSAAQAIHAGKFNAIGILQGLNVSQSNLNSDMLMGILKAIGSRHMHCPISTCSDEAFDDVELVPRVLREILADAVLVNYHGRVSDTIQQWVDSHNMPAIWINQNFEYDAIRPDDWGLGKMSAARLIELGHKKIAYLDPNFHTKDYFHFSQEDRFAGYCDTMTKHGLKANVLAAEKHQMDDFPAWLVEVLRSKNRPTAIISPSDAGLGALRVAAAITNTIIPRDLSVISFGQIRWHSWPELTTMGPHWQDIGKQAIEYVLEKMNAPNKKLPARVVPCELREGYSDRPPPA